MIPDFADAHPEEGGWQVLARWVSENLAFGSLYFFPTLWAVNVSWHEAMQGTVYSYAVPKGRGGET